MFFGVRLLSLGSVYDEYVNRPLSLMKVAEPGQDVLDYVLYLADRFAIVASATVVLREIGEVGLSSELIRLSKYLTSELILKLSQGVYVDGLASDIFNIIGLRLSNQGIDEGILRSFLSRLITVWIKVCKSECGCDDAELLVKSMCSTFNMRCSESKIVDLILNTCSCRLAIQAGLLALLAFVGGLNDVYDVKD